MSIRDKVPVGDGEMERWRDGDPPSLKLRRAGREKGSEHNSTLKTQHSKLSLSKKYSFRSTYDIINACKKDKLPNQIMMNFHPQRWTDDPVKWTQELVWQNVKNVVKAGVVRVRGGVRE